MRIELRKGGQDPRLTQAPAPLSSGVEKPRDMGRPVETSPPGLLPLLKDGTEVLRGIDRGRQAEGPNDYRHAALLRLVEEPHPGLKPRPPGRNVSANGEQLLQSEEYTLPGPVPFTWARYYRSGLDEDIGLGFGWSHSARETLKLLGTQVILHDALGTEIRFPRPPLKQSTQQLNEGLVLEFAAADRFILHQQGQYQRVFTRHGAGDRFLLKEIRHEAYEPSGVDRMGQRVPARGFALSFQHNPAGRVIRIVGNWGRGLGFERDKQGRITAVHQLNASGERLEPAISRYGYDDEGDLISYTNAAGAAEQYRYRHHVIVEHRLSTGHRHRFEWDRHDTQARCLKSAGEDGSYTTVFEWDPAARTGRATNGRGYTRTYRYDAVGQILEKTDGEGGRWQYTHANGRRTGITDPEGRHTRFLYDKANRLTGYQDALGQNAAASYFRGRLSSFTDVDGAHWKREYDIHGLLTLCIDPEGGQTRFEYDANGLPVRVIDATERSTYLKWNERAELVRETDVFGNTRNYDYDAWGRIEAITLTPRNGEPRRTRYRYTPLGQVTAVIAPDDTRSDYHYDAQGRLLRHTDAQGRITEYRYDTLGRVIARIDALGGELHYEYDSESNLTALVNENGERAQFVYDGCERLIEERGFDGRRQQYRYNRAGELIEHIDAQSVSIRYERDVLGRMLERECRRAVDPENAASEIDKFRYDPRGRITEAYNARHYLARAYDKRGLLIEERHQPRNSKGQLIKGADSTFKFRYDMLGQCTAIVLPDARELAFEYHASGGCRAVALDAQALVGIIRDGLGRATRIDQGALRAHYRYDENAQLTRLYIDDQIGQTRLDWHYRYDSLGRLSAIEEAVAAQGVQYHYDALDRIERVEAADKEQFEYDAAGNTLDARRPPMSGFIKGNRLKYFEEAKFEFDARGNLSEEHRRHAAGHTRQYVYDYHNQLVQVLEGERTTRYTYDPLGRRREKKDAEGVTTYLWAGDTLIQEQREGARITYVFEPGGARPLVRIDNDEVRHYLVDHLGTVQALADAQGQILWQARYRVWGRTEAPGSNEIDNALRFQGHYFDEESGLHYCRTRYYHPSTGRFVSQDKRGLEGGLNLYLYAPNPIEWIHPRG